MKSENLYNQAVSPADMQLIKHIPEQFINEIKIKNFILARAEEKQKKLYLKSKPYHLVVEPTNACNLGCPLCPTGIGAKTRSKGVMKMNSYKRIIDELGETALEIYFQNWGESTLVAELPLMIKHAASKGIYTHLSTNFSRKYKQGFLEDLIDSGLALLHIDLDGLTQEVYEKYRKKGDLQLVLKNINLAVDIKKKTGVSFPQIEVSMLAMKHNEHQFEDFKKMAIELEVDHYQIDKIQVDPNSNASKSWLPNNKEYIYDTYNGEDSNTQCRWPWSGMVINWDGSVSPCCIVDSPKADFGNVYEKSIMEIWNNDYYRSSRAEFGDQEQIVKQTICNICKNKTHNKKLKRVKDTFAITLD
jgi:radical SAM protein with 4Fe4S-binding SPASM domain